MPYPLFFAHANGFPASSYGCFLKHLKGSTVDYIDRLGHGAYDPRKGWRQSLSQEIIDHLDAKKKGPAVAIGHSLGGVLCFFAAQARPDLFKAVIMLDPPVFHPYKRFILALLGSVGLIRYVPPASKARKRRTYFASAEEARDYFAGKSLFRNFDPNCLDGYIQKGLQAASDGKGVELSFSAEVEYQIFAHVPYRLGAKRLEVPSYFVHSTLKEVLDSRDLKWLKQTFYDTQFLAAEGGHLFPLERPVETAALLNPLILSL